MHLHLRAVLRERSPVLPCIYIYVQSKSLLLTYFRR